MDIKIKCSISSTEIYTIYCSNAQDYFPDFAEERPTTYTNCDGTFHGVTEQPFHHHHPLISMDASHPAASKSDYVQLTRPAMVAVPLDAGLGVSPDQK